MPLPRGYVALERALSKLSLASRKDARALILTKQVTVNGRVVTDPLHPVVPERDTFRIGGGAPAIARAWRLIAFHKPRGVVTTHRDPQGRRTVFDLIGEDANGLIAVGRLDLASTGLLLLTNDTQLANRLTDPASAETRRYVVTVRGEVSDDDAGRLESGIAIPLKDDSELIRASSVTITKRSRRETHLLVELQEGKNREIRRLFEAIGHEVTRLLRISFAGVELGTLQPGQWREVERDELAL